MQLGVVVRVQLFEQLGTGGAINLACAQEARPGRGATVSSGKGWNLGNPMIKTCGIPDILLRSSPGPQEKVRAGK